MAEVKRAVVLVSGGLDSATILAIARSEGYEPYALSFDYGQRHQFELRAAERVCQAQKVARHVTLVIDLRGFGGSALTSELPVPKNRSLEDMEAEIPVTYVPARNTVFLSFAIGWGEVLEAYDIFIGVNAVDYSGYPDCRPEFIHSFENVARLGTKAGVEHRGNWKIHTPLISLTKGEIIRKGTELGVDYGLTHTCYDPDLQGRACGHCDACLLRLKGFQEAGLVDPVPYATIV